MIRPGLCSITLRQLPAPKVAELAAQAGLACVEWGGDVHVPPSETATARQVAALTADCGLAVASYGSYYRAGVSAADDFPAVLSSAVALGAPRIRIWAGDVGSAEVDGDGRRTVIEAAQQAADQAADEGIDLAFEFHRDTLTDDLDSTLALLAEVGRDNVTTYWQPPNGMADHGAIETLRRLGPAVPAVHVFSWWPDTERLALAERAALWRQAFDVVGGYERDVDALLEFVPDDEPQNLLRDAAELRRLIAS
jgi:3-dehydroshikimate dehydratase